MIQTHHTALRLLPGIFTLILCGCGYFGWNSGDAVKTPEKNGGKEETSEDRFKFLRKDEKEPGLAAPERKKESDELPLNSGTGLSLTGKQLHDLESPAPEGAAKGAAGKLAPFYEDFILLDGDETLAVSLVFNSAPVQDVIPAFADVLGFNFVADPDLKGTVTLNLNSNMTKRELWNTFDRMLALSGAAVRADGSLLRILPVAKLGQQSDLAVGGTAPEVCYFPLKNTTAKDVVTQLKPFLGKDAAISELTRPNAILLSDSASNIVKIREILELIDRSGKGAWPRLVMKCDNILPSKIVGELKEVFPVLGFYVLQTTDKTEQPGSIQLSAIDRLQIIVASAATNEAVAEIRNWIAILDSAQSLDQERVFVYKVLHGKADQLLQALSVIYNTTGQALTIDTDTGDNRTQNYNTAANAAANTRRTTTQQNNGLSATANAVNNTANTQTDQSSSLFENPVRVFADGVLNRLVIRTTPRTYASIKAMLDRMDVVPAQVLLQVVVVEVTLDKSTEFGLELSAAGTAAGQGIVAGNDYSGMNPFTVDTTKDSSGNVTGRTYTPNSETGAHALLYNPDNPSQKFGYIKALAKNNNVKVVSCPQVLVSSHNKAEIWVGQKVPYTASAVTDTASQTSSSSSFLTSVSFEEIGIRLTITPQVTSNDYISLEVAQELSDVDTENKYTTVDAPVFRKRTVDTSMTLQNGRTMVIGGLIQETKIDDLQTIPFIESIPLFRRLFGDTNAQTKRTEILLLITGNIVHEKSEIETMIKKYNDALKALNLFDDRLGDRPGANKPVHTFGKEGILEQ